MKLKEMKQRIYKLIEEYSDNDGYTEDEDLSLKINSCINIIMNELARFKKISDVIEMDVAKNETYKFEDISDDVYQINIVKGVENIIIGNEIEFLDDGTAKIYYYKYPTQITDKTNENTYEFELDTDVLEILPYGVAGLLFASDVSNNYGQIYTNLYREKLSQLDSRNVVSSIYIDGGIDI